MSSNREKAQPHRYCKTKLSEKQIFALFCKGIACTVCEKPIVADDTRSISKHVGKDSKKDSATKKDLTLSQQAATSDKQNPLYPA